IARRLPIVISHAPGLSGTPLSGHCSRAATSASAAASSARPTSRTSRASPAIRRADSMRQTASTTRCASRSATRPLNHGHDSPARAFVTARPGSACPFPDLGSFGTRSRAQTTKIREVGGEVGGGPLVLAALHAQPLLGLAQVVGHRVTEVVGLEDLADL